MHRDTVQDPVCGMTLSRADAAASATWEGQTYYFCCVSCREAFEADPQRHLQRSDRAEEAS